MVEFFIPRTSIVQLGRQRVAFEYEPNRGFFRGVGVVEYRGQILARRFGHYKHHSLLLETWAVVWCTAIHRASDDSFFEEDTYRCRPFSFFPAKEQQELCHSSF